MIRDLAGLCPAKVVPRDAAHLFWSRHAVVERMLEAETVADVADRMIGGIRISVCEA